MNDQKKNWKDFWLTIVIAVSTMAITLVDFNTSRGMAIGTLYMVPVVLSLWLRQRRVR